MIGGVLLGFFGCLGAIGTGSGQLVLVMLALGLAVVIWGIVTIVRTFLSAPPPTEIFPPDPPSPSLKE